MILFEFLLHHYKYKRLDLVMNLVYFGTIE